MCTRKTKPGAIDPATGAIFVDQLTTSTYVSPVAAQANFRAVATVTDPKANVTTWTYNPDGTLQSVKRPAVSKPGAGMPSQPTTSYLYAGGLGRVTQVTDPEGRVTRTDYDPTKKDEVVKVTSDPTGLNLATQYAYDAYGDANSVTDANSHVTLTAFDALRRPTGVTYPAAPGISTTYAYDGDSRVTSISRATESGTPQVTTATYSLTGRKLTLTEPGGAPYTTTWTYDGADRLLTATDAEARRRTTAYDALSRLATVSDTSAARRGAAHPGDVPSIREGQEVTPMLLGRARGLLLSPSPQAESRRASPERIRSAMVRISRVSISASPLTKRVALVTASGLWV